MGFVEFLLLLVVAAICGRIGQSLAGYSSGGWLTAIVVGFIGAYLGTFIAHELSLPALLTVQIGRESFPIVWSVLGAAIFTLVLAWMRRALK